MSIYNYEVKKANGELISLDQYKGKVVLIVNSATECGFTPQYDDLQNMYDKFGHNNFVILDFPCNQFGNQAPGTEDEIQHFCSSRFGITFPLFTKINCNGDKEEPLYTYLKSKKSFEGFDDAHEITKILKNMLAAADPEYTTKPDIKWNFTKFLIDRNGEVVERFEPTANMKLVESKVEELI